MKKTLLFAAVAAMTMTACSQNESTEIPGVSDDTKSINFVTSTGTTRANDTDLDALKVNGVPVYGMKKVDTDAPELLFAKPDYDLPATTNLYKWFTTKWAWEFPDAVDKKWPTASDAYPLQFFAAFPDRSDIFNKWNPNYDKPYTEQNWTLEVGGDSYLNIRATGPNQDDYMVALSDVATTVPTNGMAELNFKHIMSNILFSIVTPQNYKVYIQELKLKNIGGGSAGEALYRVFDKDPLKRGVWEEAAAGNRTASYSYFSEMYTGTTPKATVTGVVGNTAVRIYSDPTDETSKKISPKLMPQKNTSVWSKADFKSKYDAWVLAGSKPGDYQANVLDATHGAYIEVTYALVDADNVCIVGQVKDSKNPKDQTVYADTRYVTVAFPLDFAATAWEQGKKYMYNLRFGMPDSSNGVVTEPNYKDENGAGTTDPVENPVVKPGEDVTNTDRQIDFTVGISDWADGTGTDIK